jgi:type VI secretion system protein ImpK
MTPPFAKAVDPIFMRVLGLLDRIEQHQPASAQDERVVLRGLLDQAEAALGQTKDWELAKHALVYWIDEVLIETPWDGQSYWEQNPFEVELFGIREAWSQFYYKAREAASLSKKDAIEVFYVCVVLGFRGLYREGDPAAAEAHGLPPSLEEWAKQASLAVLKSPRPSLQGGGHPGDGAPPLEGQQRLIAACMLTALLAACLAAVGFWLVNRQREGDSEESVQRRSRCEYLLAENAVRGVDGT